MRRVWHGKFSHNLTRQRGTELDAFKFHPDLESSARFQHIFLNYLTTRTTAKPFLHTRTHNLFKFYIEFGSEFVLSKYQHFYLFIFPGAICNKGILISFFHSLAFIYSHSMTIRDPTIAFSDACKSFNCFPILILRTINFHFLAFIYFFILLLSLLNPSHCSIY